MNLRDFASPKERRLALEKATGVLFKHTGMGTLDESVASQRNCENMIGVAQVPLGVAGPLRINPVKGKSQDIYVPLATTEGALVASVSRGCKAILESGGAAVHAHRVGASRGPVFKVKNLAENVKLYAFLKEHIPEFQEIAEKTSHHLKLTKVNSKGVGLYRYVRFVYDTQDAMGLNMVTIATDPIARYIEEKTGARCISLSGNFCVDKKASWQNFVLNRGIKAWAEIVLTESVLKNTLKTTAANVYEVWLAKCMLGSAMSGSMGYNAQFANIVAALFLATGQDLAHVVEGSLGITTAQVTNGTDVYIGVYLPDLMVGTVGGGTGLATQQEALRLLGVAGGSPVGEGGRNAGHLAEVIAGVVLAGEISLLSSLEQGTLAQAHQKLARGKIL